MNTLMAQGLELMLIGMGVVFSFLIILAGDLPSPSVIKAIEKAVRQHRQSQQ